MFQNAMEPHLQQKWPSRWHPALDCTLPLCFFLSLSHCPVMLLHLLLVSLLCCLFSALLKTGLKNSFFCLTLPPLFTNKVTLCRTVSKRTEFSSYFSFPPLSFFHYSRTSLLARAPSRFHCVCVTLWSLIALWSLLFFGLISCHSFPASFPPMFFSSQYVSKSLSVSIQTKLEFWHSRLTR